MEDVPPVSNRRTLRSKCDISKRRGDVGMEGRRRVQTCAVTWWHTVAGNTGGVGVRLGRDLAQVPWGEPVRRAWPTRVRLLVQSQLHVIRHVG